ncbi:MAG: phosphoenolpyruvate carboxylase, partial [Thermoleophilia bacterium]|nr:phosphoenolpyruvate carboxylase [Thermoleophilia bacterium]
MVSATIEASVLDADGLDDEQRARAESIMDELSELAHREYRSLVYETDGFVDFFRSITPIDEIAKLNIGSRPASRTASRRIEDLRAIPWVFAWTQNRCLLPSWYGCGTALAPLAASSEGLDRLREMRERWPYFRALVSNLEMTLAKASMPIARTYLDLVPPVDDRDRIWAAIEHEHERTVQAVLAIVDTAELLDSQQAIQRSIQLRNPYVDPINLIQVELLESYRATPDDDPQRDERARVLARSIAGIAAALRNTG